MRPKPPLDDVTAFARQRLLDIADRTNKTATPMPPSIVRRQCAVATDGIVFLVYTMGSASMPARPRFKPPLGPSVIPHKVMAAYGQASAHKPPVVTNIAHLQRWARYAPPGCVLVAGVPIDPVRLARELVPWVENHGHDLVALLPQTDQEKIIATIRKAGASPRMEPYSGHLLIRSTKGWSLGIAALHESGDRWPSYNPPHIAEHIRSAILTLCAGEMS